MRRFSLGLLVVALFVTTTPADMIAPNPTPLRLALAPVALVGKVTSIEEKPILAARFPGAQEKVPFLVAVVKIEKGLSGTQDRTHVRVAFPQPVPLPQPIPGEPQLSRPRVPGPKLEKDQEVLLFLRPHESENVLVPADPFGFVIATGNPNFKAEVTEAEKTAKLLAEPIATLKNKDANTRYQTAALLLHRYSQGVPGMSKKVAIDAEESKLLLTALAEADWNPNQPGRYFQLAPLQTFFRLGLTEADGWKQPREFKDFPTAARKWLSDNSGTYRIKRNVPLEP